MRFLLLLVACGLLFLSAAAAPLPADTAVLRVNSLSPKGSQSGLLLENGWRYQVGDNSQWARPDFDDSAWDTINPARPRQELPPRLRTDISWLRLRFRLADSLRQRAIMLQVAGYGAWEIYLNGRLLQRHGRVQANPTYVPDSDKLPPVVVPRGGPAEQVLAIRFAPWHSPLLRLAGGKQLLNVYLRSEAQVQQRVDARVKVVLRESMMGGIFGLLTLLHLVFFRYYPAQRANLYFAFFTGTFALGFLAAFSQWALAFSTPAPRLLLGWIRNPLILSAYPWVVRAVYALFGFRPGWVYRGLWALFGVVLLSIYGGSYFGFATLPLMVISVVELLRLTGRALRQQHRGAWIIGAGFAVMLLIFVLILGLVVVSALLNVPDPTPLVFRSGWGD
ncbi:hypothetical protein [Hymenobacter sp. HDW8]|uniref:hypothetical protein n=1 Tax=Hymenobacter sp. HDW8 TaxID=2714932 RepID=UPI001F0E7785|nr:hypothetical protein [Hymenobacter sp. HDW8]